MENINLIDSFAEFKELKNIDRATMMSVIEDVFRSVLIRQFGTDENYDVIINIDKGDFEIWRNRVVVEDGELEDPNTQITLSDAQKIDTDYEVGEDVLTAFYKEFLNPEGLFIQFSKNKYRADLWKTNKSMAIENM